ncbi:hypothetical protein H310_12676 [Aphanomyces invadans]|uniref:Uncharacterized protein n=1 Tax=Aphanomyces invadans TaxID=157072 RepID=A0A024TIP0_9STRA|nr:hypothetical protein H310_12676 [Aphanomyces invadans]ETV93232.1 hypothetical protein H310_12676 [Aphanomyces invadans]|eukprot:XP_008878067.1 hypothetical protein H310_12676 [Aphanomyces invadans]
MPHDNDSQVNDYYLLKAAKSGNVAKVQTCLSNGANINSSDERGRTPLHKASQKGHVTVVEMLVERGAGIDATEEDGWTPLHLASQNGHVDVVKRLLGKGANVHASEELGRTPLHIASDEGHVTIVEFLVERGADIDASDQDGWTPLFLASRSGHVDVVKKLLEKDANVNASKERGWTPLHIASDEGHVAIVEMLVEQGADIDASDQVGRTPLLLATKKGRVDVVKKLLEKDANVHASEERGWTPLHIASVERYVTIVEMLVEQGADMDASDEDGQTPLFLASQNGHLDVVMKLVEKGANVHASNKRGWTPLHTASQDGHVTIVEKLLSAEADLCATNSDGKTPRELAVHLNDGSVVDVLDLCAQDRALTCFCAGDLAMAEKYARLVITILKIDKSAFVWIGDKLLEQCKHEEAETFGLPRNCPDCAAVLEKICTIQVAQEFSPGAVHKLAMAKDPSIQAFLQNDKAMSTFRSVVDNPTHYHSHKTLLEPVLVYLASLDKVGAEPRDVLTPTEHIKDLYEAARMGDLTKIQACVENGADVNCLGELGETPLHWAAWTGHLDVVMDLIEKGAIVDATDNDGETPLDWASINGHAEVVQILVEKGASVNAVCDIGWTPLHHAALNGHEDTVMVLHEKVATIDVTDENGETPLHVVLKNGRVNVVVKLLEAGADLLLHQRMKRLPETLLHLRITPPLWMPWTNDRALMHFCAGDVIVAEKYATLVTTALKVDKSAVAWIGESLYYRGHMEQALVAFETGQKIDSSDIDCVVGREDVRDTIQVATAFRQNDLFPTLAIDQKMRDYLRDKAFASLIKSVQANPTLYDKTNERLADLFQFLQNLHKTTERAPTPMQQPSRAPPPPVTSSTSDAPITTLPAHASLAELANYLRLPGCPLVDT